MPVTVPAGPGSSALSGTRHMGPPLVGCRVVAGVRPRIGPGLTVTAPGVNLNGPLRRGPGTALARPPPGA
jgi:hypothetical protein